MPIVTIVSNGPSSKGLLFDPATLLLTVNDSLYRGDWLTLGDTDLLGNKTYDVPLPTRGYCVSDQAVESTRRFAPARPVIPWSCLSFPEDPGSSANVMLWFAANILGATTLHLHGFDLQGDTYANGRHESPHEWRWAREARQLQRIVQALRLRGVEIHQHGQLDLLA